MTTGLDLPNFLAAVPEMFSNGGTLIAQYADIKGDLRWGKYRDPWIAGFLSGVAGKD